MNLLPKVSVITVVFNGEAFIQKTIKSVIEQTYSNIEYIIIDGASTDKTLEIARKHEAGINLLVSEPDQGIYDAMNKGMTACTGDYLIFMNAGDTFFSKETLNEIPFGKHPKADIFYGETVIIDENTGEELGLRQKKLPPILSWKSFKRGMVTCHQSVLMKRSIVSSYDTSYRLAADVNWMIESLKNAQETIFTHSIISKFLNGGVSRTMQKESLKERFRIMTLHFGLYTTICSHLGFVIENVLIKLGVKPLYRKNYFQTM